MPASFLSSTANRIGPGLAGRKVLMVNKTGSAALAGEATQWGLQGIGTYVDYDEGTDTSAFACVGPVAVGATDLVGIGAAYPCFVSVNAIAADGDTDEFWMYGPTVPCLADATAADRDIGSIFGTVDAATHLQDEVTSTCLRLVGVNHVLKATADNVTLVDMVFDGWNGIFGSGV